MAETTNPQPAACRILIVEDEYLVAMEISEALEHEGFVIVGPVASVNDALTLLNAGQAVDGAVLDINLGNQNVFPLADVLQRRMIPFVFATGYSAAVIPAGYAAVPRCEKPVNEVILVRMVKDLLRHAG